MEPSLQPAATSGFAMLPAWRRSVAWLLFLGPFFFISYGFANHMAAAREVTASFVFGWEHHIPFVPWTIVPYWSIDLLYGLSFLLCRDNKQVDTHALRLLTAQLISVSCFLVFPLHFAFDRPQTNGMFGVMFDALNGFDQPYNQAPSLHISLLVILWARYGKAIRGPWNWIVHVWALLIGISVLTTYQHHFIDVPTGALVGVLCLWMWPDTGRSLLIETGKPISTRQQQIGLYYLAAACILAMTAAGISGAALWLWWGAIALALVSLIYLRCGAIAGFQKIDGRHSVAVRILLAPYLVVAWLNSRWWTRGHPDAVPVMDDVWLGRMPTGGDMQSGQFTGLCDLAAEMSAPHGRWRYAGLSWIDLVTPTVTQLTESAQQIEALRVHGPVLVCCALGYSRSASAVLAWLLVTRRAASVEEAESILRACRPQIVLHVSHRTALSALMRTVSEP